MSSGSNGLEKVLAVISLIVCCIALACAVWGLIELIACGLCDWRALIYIGYLIFFAVMMILLEVKATGKFLEWFGFLRNFAGKGFFFIFLGLIAFGVPLSHNVGLFIGGFVILYGIILIIVYFVHRKDVKYDAIR